MKPTTSEVRNIDCMEFMRGLPTSFLIWLLPTRRMAWARKYTTEALGLKNTNAPHCKVGGHFQKAMGIYGTRPQQKTGLMKFSGYQKPNHLGRKPFRDAQNRMFFGLG
jgi:hypothetical protein